jgi:hypothetical protein
MARDHQQDYPSRSATVLSIAEKIGCLLPTLYEWVKKGEMADRLKALEHENRELWQANEISRKASACFCLGGARPPIQAMTSFIDEHPNAYGAEPSVGNVGDSYDNALAETINGLYKAEVIHRRGPWRSFKGLEYATLEWVEWFNNKRLLAPTGNIPPAEAEERYCAMLDEQRMAAQLSQIASDNPRAVH